jgi:hypothetical protein
MNRTKSANLLSCILILASCFASNVVAQTSAPQADAGAVKRVTVTLVRWPYT